MYSVCSRKKYLKNMFLKKSNDNCKNVLTVISTSEHSGQEFFPVDLDRPAASNRHRNDFQEDPMTSSDTSFKNLQRSSPSPRRSLSRSRDIYPDERPERPSQRSSRSPQRMTSNNSRFFSSRSGPSPEEDNARFLFQQPTTLNGRCVGPFSVFRIIFHICKTVM
jgi:hypothetical protein